MFSKNGINHTGKMHCRAKIYLLTLTWDFWWFKIKVSLVALTTNTSILVQDNAVIVPINILADLFFIVKDNTLILFMDILKNLDFH